MEDILKKFGKAVRELRNDKGWSQEKMAQLCGFDRTYIGRVERGERNLSLRNVEKLSQTLGVSLSQIFKNL